MKRSILALSMAFLVPLAWAEELPCNLVSFDAHASRQVDNDTAYATLFVELSDADPARLAERINQTLNAASKKARQGGVLQSLNTGYSTYPLYNKQNKPDGWRARGELRLVSRDFPALARLIGDLQQGQQSLQLADVSYGLSDEARQKVENELIGQGLQVFRERAALVQKSMNSKSWRLVNVSINTQSARPPVLMRTAKAAEMSMAASLAPIEGGESALSVSIQGRIELE